MYVVAFHSNAYEEEAFFFHFHASVLSTVIILKHRNQLALIPNRTTDYHFISIRSTLDLSVEWQSFSI